MSHETDIDFDAIIRAESARRPSSALRLTGAIALSLLWLLPFYYLFVTVFKSTEEYASKNPLALPSGLWPILENATAAWSSARMAAGMFNSTLYGLCGAAIAVFLAAAAACGMTRFQFRGKALWFMLIFSGMVFPFQMYLIPLFFTYNSLGILNTHGGMILFYSAICIPFPFLVLRNYMNGISREIDEAARMDGAGEWTIFLRILIPNCWGPITATFLIQFTWIWNDLIFSTVLANRESTRSIMNALQSFQSSYSVFGPNTVLTAALIASLPSIILFLILRKHFMRGLTVNTT
ncbi:carbohydrate ABC transporter permease [Ruegeria jejuensis]|uniref:carbohydrate ABC transporter permease n=1 Tax=Ruegeria jejuensis TaxID=3233338 RepID=UPI00355C4104